MWLSRCLKREIERKIQWGEQLEMMITIMVKRYARILLGIMILLPVCGQGVALPSVSTGVPGDHNRTIVVNGLQRFFTIHVPSVYDGTKPIPVILNFHGGGGNSKTQRHISRMDASADRNGYIVVYPQGTNKKSQIVKGFTWNAGGCCGWARDNNIDDVGFTAKLLDSLQNEFLIDEKRVYATGISNGAIMSYRLACEMPDRIAAIAPVAGPLEMKNCNPERAVSVIHFHGTKDEFAPYNGGTGKHSLQGQYFNSVKNTLATWKIIDGLGNIKPEIINITPNVRSEAYRSKRAEFVLYTIKDGGHTWPGGQFGFLGKKFLGQMNMEISANEIMWEFFQRHHLP